MLAPTTLSCSKDTNTTKVRIHSQEKDSKPFYRLNCQAKSPSPINASAATRYYHGRQRLRALFLVSSGYVILYNSIREEPLPLPSGVPHFSTFHKASRMQRLQVLLNLSFLLFSVPLPLWHLHLQQLSLPADISPLHNSEPGKNG